MSAVGAECSEYAHDLSAYKVYDSIVPNDNILDDLSKVAANIHEWGGA